MSISDPNFWDEVNEVYSSDPNRLLKQMSNYSIPKFPWWPNELAQPMTELLQAIDTFERTEYDIYVALINACVAIKEGNGILGVVWKKGVGRHMFFSMRDLYMGHTWLELARAILTAEENINLSWTIKTQSHIYQADITLYHPTAYIV